jgi:hypothetical protein
MDLDTAYNVMMGFARQLKLPSAMCKLDDGAWEVHVQAPGQPEVVIRDVEAGRAMYRKLTPGQKSLL